MKTKLTLIILLLLQLSRVYAQSSDAVKYYIAYDRSGSVAYLDRNNNLQEMLKELLEVAASTGNVNTPAGFDIYLFGEQSRLTPIHYDRNNPVPVSTLLNSTRQSRQEEYTHIHTALQQIATTIDADRQTNPKRKIATGVLIFTDGRVDTSDIDFDQLKNEGVTDRNGYLKYRDDLIKKLKDKTNNNVYIIQTSPLQSPYFNLDSSIIAPKERLVVDSSYIYSDKFFWLSTKKRLADTAANYLELYKDFIHDMNASIISPGWILPNDSIATIILMQEIFQLKEKLAKTKATKEYRLIEDNPDMKKISATAGLVGSYRMETIKQNDTEEKNKSETEGSRTSGHIINKAAIDAAYENIMSLGNTKNTSGDNISDLIKLKNDLLEELKEVETEQVYTTPILLSDAYTAATPTPVTEISQNKGLENIEQSIILGLTDYVIDRAKQEAVYAFLDNLNNVLFKSDNTTDIKKVLFPNVAELIENKVTYPDLTILQAAFKEDVKKLPENLVKMRNKGHSEGVYTLYFFIRLYDQLTQSGSLEGAFTKVKKEVEEEIKCIKSQNDNKNRCNLLNALESVQYTTSLISYLERYDLASIYNDDRDLDMLSRLLVILSINRDSVACIDIDGAAMNARIVYKEYLLVKRQMGVLQDLMAHKPTSDYEGYRQYQKDILLDILQRTSNLLVAGSDIMNDIQFGCNGRDCGTQTNATQKEDIRKTINQMKKMVESWFLIKNKEYVRAVYNIVPELVEMVDDYNAKQIEYVRMLVYISGEVANAANPDDIKRIIAKYTLPVASYKIKRFNNASIMITGYPGVGSNLYKAKDYKPTPAIICPIGLEYTFRPFRKPFSISCMGSIIDIGNVINYRLLGSDNDSVSTDVVSFNRIFSPGAHISFGMCSRLPLAITTGYQFNPARFTAGLTVDMPMLGIWKSRNVLSRGAKTRKKKRRR